MYLAQDSGAGDFAEEAGFEGDLHSKSGGRISAMNLSENHSANLVSCLLKIVPHSLYKVRDQRAL